jgi:hypothetical protein
MLGCEYKSPSNESTSKDFTINDVKIDSSSLNEKYSNRSIEDSSPHKYDSIRITDLTISSLKFRSDVKQLIEKFGKPDSITYHTNEFSGGKFRNYHYSNNLFSVDSLGKVNGFEVNNKKFILNYGNIAVGNKDTVLVKMFPLSMANTLQNDSISIIRVHVENSPDYILFQTVKGNIINFMYWENW